MEKHLFAFDIERYYFIDKRKKSGFTDRSFDDNYFVP
jgi:hypothetical protein